MRQYEQSRFSIKEFCDHEKLITSFRGGGRSCSGVTPKLR